MDINLKNFKKIIVGSLIIMAFAVLILGIRKNQSSLAETTDVNNTVSGTETKTTTEKISDTVSRTTTITTRRDSDGDGIFDNEDKYPNINDNFVVKDENINGIDDRYEQ
jgi:hypothetical protein